MVRLLCGVLAGILRYAVLSALLFFLYLASVGEFTPTDLSNWRWPRTGTASWTGS